MAKVGYFDYRSAKSRYRKRVVVWPAGAGDLTVTGPVPEWGADHDPASDWRRLPRGAFNIAQLDENDFNAGFEDYLAGMESAPVVKIEIDYSRFHNDDHGVASADIQAIAVWLRNYVAADAGTISWTGYSRSFDLTNVWRMYSDGGDASLTFSEFDEVYRGCQRRMPSKSGAIFPGTGFTEQYEIVSVTRATLDEMRMSDVCEYVKKFVTPVGQGPFTDPDYRAGWHYRAYIDSWPTIDGGGFGAQLNAFYVRTDPAKYFRFTDLWISFEAVASIIHNQLIRDGGGGTSGGGAGSVGFWRYQDAEGSNGYPPDHHITYYKRTFSRQMEPGDALSKDDELFLGILGVEDIPNETITPTYGLLMAQPENKDLTLNRDDYSGWQFLDDLANGTGIRIKTSTYDAQHMGIYPAPVLGSHRTPREVTLSDIVNDGHDKGDAAVEFEEGFEVAAFVKAAARDVQGGPSELERKADSGTYSDDGGTVTTMWDNWTPIMQFEDWSEEHGPADLWSDDELYVDWGWSITRPFVWKVYYLDSVPRPSAGVTSIPVPVLVHRFCDFVDGYHTHSQDLVKYEDAVGSGKADLLEVLMHWVTHRKFVGLPAALCQALVDIFGNAQNTKYSMKFRRGVLDVHDAGNELRLAPAWDVNDDRYTANALVDNSDIPADHLPGRTWIKKLKIDEASDHIEVELYGLEQYTS